MKHAKPRAMGLLLGGLISAVGTPIYVSYAEPSLAGYLLHPTIFLVQMLPYLLCAALWLPWRVPGAATTAVVLAALLLVAGLVVYTPMVLAPGAQGGDMIGLAFVAISIGMTTGLLVGSTVAWLVLWRRRHSRRGDPRQVAT